ncbi:hypothetical protein HBI25_094230 [Parastagonospora nodorum]|nr:hypothetical protein HBH53_060300 [Parastagonospora nodorum]KAH3999343.1 hypothetical protein HBI10_120110 [Parastagonospora nodorum]KAH4025069.1 hypothetical protein HBI13_077080 [Parastagonospora nodorum]KAH4206326.1 hypothetical protein HBI95_126910 [Parastagonospora nodorum]KAH4603338.1 hypothetical protein HBH82_147580 [Parastagonospora nodorum]
MPSNCSRLSGLRLYPRVTSWSTSPRPISCGFTPQWQILRNLHSSRTSCRIPLSTKSTLFGTRRGYAETATPDSTASPPIRNLNSAILIPSSLKHAQPDIIVNHIQPLPRPDVYRDSLCVFLVTPSFAPWLVNDEFFLAKAIRRAYSNAHKDLTIQAICAVVDKLPAGRAMASGMTLQDVVKQRSTEPPVGDTGFEGIAYVMLPSSASVPSTAPRSPDKGAIDFILSGYTGAKRPYSDTWRLPLANTVFQTGSPTTMYYTNWTLDAKEKTVALQERTDVTHHGIRMAASGTESGQMSSVLSIPLLPLTFPRTVEGGMGNIIRRIIDDEGQSVTAASELEKVVPRFFKARGEPAQPTTAWALVMRGRQKRNKDIKTKRILGKNILKSEKGKNMHEVLWDRLWQSNPPQWSTYVSTAIAEGASLHRVLSGGGGWGKKAGLLSLDPVPVSEEVPIRMEDATSGFEGPGDFSTALTPVVRDGDAIQFFIAPAPASEVDGDKALENLKSLPKQRAPGWELGVIPSTVDSFPGGSWQHVGADSEYIAVFRNSFGALSEGGLTLTRRRGQNRRDPLYPFGTTTIDAPYSRLWSVELADKEISNNDVRGQDSDSQEIAVSISDAPVS